MEKMSKKCSRLEQQKAKMKREMARLEQQLATARRRSENMRRNQNRLKKQKEKKTVSETNKPRAAKKVAAVKKEWVIKFLCRDENSRLLAGKKDTITKNKQKVQRRVLTKPLKELHKIYNKEAERGLSLSYRQFVRLRPFYITEPKVHDRNTCACIDHENVKLLVDKLHQNGMLKTSSVSELIASIVCDTKNKQCMYRACEKCSNNKIDLVLPKEAACTTWQQWEREKTSNGERSFTNFVKNTMKGTWKDLCDDFN